MATLSKLAADGVITQIEVELEGDVLPWRCLYGLNATNFINWLSNTLPTMETKVDADLTPEQQVDAVLELYVNGAPLGFGNMYKPLYPHAHGVWEFKTSDVRIFGWFPKKDHFIAVFGDDSTYVHKHKLHHGYAGQVIRRRNQLDLDPPKFVPGGNPDDVISICS